MNKMLLILLLFSGCASQPTKIIWHDGREIVINSDKNSLITVKLQDGKEVFGEVTIDKRKVSNVSDFIKMVMFRMFSDTNIGARK